MLPGMKLKVPKRRLAATLFASLVVAAQAYALCGREAGPPCVASVRLAEAAARSDRLAQVVQALRGNGHRGAETATPPALAWLGLLACTALLAAWLRRRNGDAVMTIGDGGETPDFCARP